MARAGRKRKEGRREASGRLQRPTLAQIAAAQKSAQDVEKIIVLAQPHRRGSHDPMTESALGRFLLRMGTDNRPLFDAGQDYAKLRAKWLSLWSAPLADRDAIAGSGGDVDMATQREWLAKLGKLEDAMLQCGVAGLGWVESLASDNKDMPVGHPAERETLCALNALAVELGIVAPKRR